MGKGSNGSQNVLESTWLAAPERCWSEDDMDQKRVAKLEADGWTVGTVKEFLNLAEEEMESLEKGVPVPQGEQRTHR